MHASFADWYRSASVSVADGVLERRWVGVESATAKLNGSFVIELTKLFVLPSANEGMVSDSLRECFRATDEGFPSKGNLNEMRVLAGAILRCAIESGDRSISTLCANAIVSGSFGDRRSMLPAVEHVEVAERVLFERGQSIRSQPNSSPGPIAAPTKKKISEVLVESHFAANQTPQLREPLIELLHSIVTSLTAALNDSRKTIEQLSTRVTVREEELNILWWLQTSHSKELGVPFSSMGVTQAAVVLPVELEKMIAYVPAPTSISAVLAHALFIAGTSIASAKMTIAEAANSAPENWRKNLIARSGVSHAGLLCPILLAIQKSLETDGPSEWLPVYRKACDVKVDAEMLAFDLSIQIYRELMLIRSIEESLE